MRLVHILIAGLAASGALLPVAVVAQADGAAPQCDVTYFTTEDLLALIGRTENPPVIEGFEALCLRLAQEGAGLRLTHNSGELSERSFGWVSVSVIDLTTQIEGTARQTTISLTQDLGQPVVEGALIDALAAALRDVARDPDPFIQSMRDEIAEIRQVLAPR